MRIENALTTFEEYIEILGNDSLLPMVLDLEMNFTKTRGKYTSSDTDIVERERGNENMEELAKKYKILADLMERLLNIPSLSRPENILRQLRVETWLESEYICSSSEIREILQRKNPYLV